MLVGRVALGEADRDRHPARLVQLGEGSGLEVGGEGDADVEPDDHNLSERGWRFRVSEVVDEFLEEV